MSQAAKVGGLVNGTVVEVQANCEIHGPYLAKKVVAFGKAVGGRCPACQKEIDLENENFKKRRQLDEDERRIQQRLAAADIPRRFQDRRIATYQAKTPEQEKLLAICDSYAKDFEKRIELGTSLVLCGKPGTGKTHLAIGIAHAAIQQGYSARFISVMNAIRRIRETYSRDSNESEREVIDAFALPHLLILDEVGQQRGSDDEKILLFDIINARYEAVRPTIIISNLDLAGIAEYLGERAFDRLREGGGKALQFTWDSYRRSA